MLKQLTGRQHAWAYRSHICTIGLCKAPEDPRDHRAQPGVTNASLKQTRACHGNNDVLHDVLKKLWTVTGLTLYI